MKILTWNINGIRASKVPLKTLFDSLDSDIICLQETKVTRDQLDERSAIVEGYNSFFSFSKKRSGYSGVATFCKDNVIPTRSEEGLTGLLSDKDSDVIGCYGDQSEFSSEEKESLDAEGRAVLTQHKIKLKNGSTSNLIIINVYIPRVDPAREDRRLYKLQYLCLLQTRTEALLKSGSHVIVVGDMNITHSIIDHVEGTPDEAFSSRPSRMWMNQFLWQKDRKDNIYQISEDNPIPGMTSNLEGGAFMDSFRYFHPDKTDAFTNWCTLTGARQTNYGQRLDYILTSTSLMSYLESCEILSEIEGSDHCPVKVELSVCIDSAAKCPQLCTKFYPEFAGKQQKLSFLIKGPKECQFNEELLKTDVESSQIETSRTGFNSKRLAVGLNIEPAAKKFKFESNKSAGPSAKQANLKNFFVRDRSHLTKNSDSTHSEISKYFQIDTSYSSNINSVVGEESKNVNGANLNSTVGKVSVKTEQKSESKSAWKTLLSGPPPPPPCKGHKEPCVLRTVKKDGPTKGKQFYVCVRADGRSNDPEARCDHFQWVNWKK